jgi:hypothetical protein
VIVEAARAHAGFADTGLNLVHVDIAQGHLAAGPRHDRENYILGGSDVALKPCWAISRLSGRRAS